MTIDAEEWLATAVAVFVRSAGDVDPLHQLEWDPAVDLRHPADRAALAAIFRGQGRTLARSTALGLLVARALVEPSMCESPVVASLAAQRSGKVVELVLPAGFDGAQMLVVDVPGDGIQLVRAAAVEAVESASGALDPTIAIAGLVPFDALQQVMGDGEASSRRDLASASARLAIAHEILGSCDSLMDMALVYSRDRLQFDAPIGSFQAVQHLLADAEVHRLALQAACGAALSRAGESGSDERDAVLVKGLAGRTGRVVLQATLQALGAIGFTWEHDHHRYARRILTLDALHGTSHAMRRAAASAAGSDGLWWSPIA